MVKGSKKNLDNIYLKNKQNLVTFIQFLGNHFLIIGATCGITSVKHVHRGNNN
jgi:hypothetical protein